MNLIREFFKAHFFRILRRILRSDLFREETLPLFVDLFEDGRIREAVSYRDASADYPGLGSSRFPRERDREDVIFISGRFRSGSTFLWNIFRNIPGCSAYYEPLLHETPEDRGTGRGGTIDPTHRGVSDYHLEFRKIPGLSEFHRSEWSFDRLFMDGFAFSPEMEQYLDRIIAQSPGRPVLQFNRVDFRLQWLKSKYPNAKILHLYRNPRNQWMSMIENDGWIPKQYRLGQESLLPEFNAFYLWYWWRDLHFLMPFLKLTNLDHPYQIHYLLWRLSYMFGKEHAHISLRYETVIGSFESVMGETLSVLGFSQSEVDRLSHLKSPPPKSDPWPRYAEEEWFILMEEKAEELLVSFFGAEP